MSGDILLDPLIPLVFLAALAALATLGTLLAAWRGLSGWWLRGLAALALLAAIANPSIQREDRAPLSDIVVLVVDESASQRIADRPDQTEAVIADVTAQIALRPNTDLRIVRMGDALGDGGTQMMTALTEALSEEPQARIAGILLLSDGRVHDMERAPNLPACMR